MSLRIGLVGHGHWGTIIEKTLRTLPNMEVVLIEKGESDFTVDGVMIATPSATHAHVALPYIRKGIPTFIEKPLATSFVDAHAIQKAAEEHTTFVQVGHIHTHNPALLAMRDHMPSLGSIRLASFEHLYALPRTDSSVLWDCLPHTLSIAYTLFGGEPSDMRAWSLAKTPTGLTEAAVTRFQWGTTTMFSYMSWLSPVKRTTLVFYGEHGTLMFDDVAKERKLTLICNDVVSYPAYDVALPLTKEITHFLEAIRSKRKEDESLALGVTIVGLINELEQRQSNAAAHINI